MSDRQEAISYLLRELGERNNRIDRLEKELSQTRKRLELSELRRQRATRKTR